MQALIKLCLRENPVKTTTNDQLRDAQQALEWWLCSHAEAGVPELALIEVLRTYADTIEYIGYVPRSWGPDTQRERFRGREREQ